MEQGFQINPHAFYPTEAVCDLLNIKKSSLDKERQRGAVQATRKAGQYIFRGSSLLVWLESPDSPQSANSPASKDRPADQSEVHRG
ncbi:helix-turn-helix domain-containing protein [Rosistilla oblonga]|uniref:helix-turn-helix domain-containing protein n=1 Tax=Rosistilla oblonga TaxID=2527990 RepID=UPI003A973584